MAGTALVVAAVGAGLLVMNGTHSGSIAGPTPSTSTKTQPTHTSASAPKNTPTIWTAPAGGDSAAVVGSWLVDNKTVVRGDAGALKAYDTETGQALWTFQPPGQGAAICAMSQAAPNNGVVLYGPKGACTTIAAIDTDNGKALWNTTPVVPKGSAPGTSPAVSLDSEVTAWQIGTTVTAWSTTGGRQLWTTDVAKAKPACRVAQIDSQGGNLALVEDCGTAGIVVAMKDAHTGRDLWHTPVPPDGLQGAQFTLVSASPTIVHVTSQGAQPVDRYYSFDPSGKLLPAINGSGDYGVLDLNTGPQGQQHPSAHVQDNVFIAPTVDKDAKASLVAFDLASGGKLWQAPATASGPVTIVALNKKWVTVFDGGAGGSAARILAYGTNGGGPNTAGINKETLGTDWSGPAAASYIAGNRVIVLPAAPEKGADVLAFPWGDAQ